MINSQNTPVQEEILNDFTKDARKIFNDLNVFLKKSISYMEEKLEKNSTTILEMKKILTSYEERMVKITEINIAAEETLTNVLLAIRQNEYLQAWYPAQAGYPDLKITGRHPNQAKTEIL